MDTITSVSPVFFRRFSSPKIPTVAARTMATLLQLKTYDDAHSAAKWQQIERIIHRADRIRSTPEAHEWTVVRNELIERTIKDRLSVEDPIWIYSPNWDILERKTDLGKSLFVHWGFGMPPEWFATQCGHVEYSLYKEGRKGPVGNWLQDARVYLTLKAVQMIKQDLSLRRGAAQLLVSELLQLPDETLKSSNKRADERMSQFLEPIDYSLLLTFDVPVLPIYRKLIRM